MKKLFTAAFLFFVFIAAAQNYRLFNSVSEKLFTTYPVQTTGYSLSLDSVFFFGGDSVYFNYFLLRDTAVPSNCTWWGGPWCTTQDVPSWAGAKIVNDNAGVYDLFTRFNDTLHFDFNFSLGDTSQFYNDGVQKFSIVYADNDTASVLGTMDSVRRYTILHTDLAGNNIFSSLGGTELIVSKDNGLVSFFQIDSFPSVLRPLTMIGKTSPAAGFYVLTNEIVYDYQPGDEVQTYHTMTQTGGPPWNNYSYYEKNTVLSRTTTTDSLIYIMEKIIYDVVASTTTIDTVEVKYHRFTVISEIPFEEYNAANNTLYVGDYCGESKWTYKSVLTPGMMYCPAENCWGPYDTGGPPVNITAVYVAGVGYYSYNAYKIASPPQGFGQSHSIVYFKKNGVTCGNEVVLGAADIFKQELRIYPNPSSGIFTVSAGNAPFTFAIYDTEGRLIGIGDSVKEQSSVSFPIEKEGIYFVKFMSKESQVTKKIVVMK